jgi:hypothetical protein
VALMVAGINKPLALFSPSPLGSGLFPDELPKGRIPGAWKGKQQLTEEKAVLWSLDLTSTQREKIS